jgi:hypothetical protein
MTDNVMEVLQGVGPQGEDVTGHSLPLSGMDKAPAFSAALPWATTKGECNIGEVQIGGVLAHVNKRQRG